VSWAVVCPIVIGVVRCGPVDRGPDVAPAVPSGTPSLPFVWSRSIEAWVQVEVTAVTVSDRQAPSATARYGTEMARWPVSLNDTRALLDRHRARGRCAGSGGRAGVGVALRPWAVPVPTQPPKPPLLAISPMSPTAKA
jgi:hypothetical protein